MIYYCTLGTGRSGIIWLSTVYLYLVGSSFLDRVMASDGTKVAQALGWQGRCVRVCQISLLHIVLMTVMILDVTQAGYLHLEHR